MSSKLWAVLVLALAAAIAGGLFVWDRFGMYPERDAIARVAVLPFDNLTDDPLLDQTARGVTVAAVRQAEALTRARVFAADTENHAIALGATHIVSGVIAPGASAYRVDYALQVVERRRTRDRFHASASPGGWLRLARVVAESIRTAIRPESKLVPAEIHTDEALRLIGASMQAETPDKKIEALRAAIASDARCAVCWESLIHLTAQSGGAQPALELSARAVAAVGGADSVGILRLRLLDATLRQDAAGRTAALELLGRVLPEDPSVQNWLAESFIAQRKLPQAIDAYRRAWEADPSRTELLNQLGYTNAWAARYDEALRWVAQYEEALPESANPSDSRGEILMMAGRFKESEAAFLASHEKDPNFNGGAALEKAAFARWLGGDMDGAGELVERFLAQRAQQRDALLVLRRARWQFLLGQAREAQANLRQVAGSPEAPGASLAASYLAIYALQTGQSGTARELAASARQTARDPLSLYAAGVATALAAGDASLAPAQDDASRLQLQALSLTLRGDYEQAASVWEQALKSAPASGDALPRELLAQTYVALGRTADASALVKRSWPLLTDDQRLLFDSFVYPALFYVRGAIADQAKRAEEARRFFEQYLQSVGNRPDPTGTARKAREAVRL